MVRQKSAKLLYIGSSPIAASSIIYMQDIQLKKIYLFLVCFFIASLFIIGQVVNLSVIERRSGISSDMINKPRGIIYDSKMRPLTINIPSYTIYLDKQFVFTGDDEQSISNVRVLYENLPSILNMSVDDLRKKLEQKRRTVTLVQNLNMQSYNKLMEVKKDFGIKSVYGVESFKRFYPYGDIFAHTIGYMNKTETEGYAGLEATYESILSSDNEEPKNIVLTLDRDIQTIVRNEVLKTVAEKSPQSVTVIVSDVDTGAIIAGYSYPSFDPNNPFVYTNGERIDRSIMSTIYPGSTMKIFAELAAIEEGVVNIDEVFHCKGYYDYSSQTRIHCDYPHGNVKFEDILKYSCNYSIVTISERIDKKFFYDYLNRFGFGKPTGVGPYKNEWSGIYHPLNKWHRYSRGYLAIGYDLSVTPMQIAASYLPLLNGGYKAPMHVVSSIFNAKENISMTNQLKVKRIIEPQYSQLARYLLRKGVESGSTGSRANLLNIDVVGKTGTAITQVLRNGEDGKIEKYYQSIFIGGFPLEAPKVSILVLLDDPQGVGPQAGRVSAPLFAKIAMQIIPYLGLLEDEIYTINTNDFLSLIPDYNIVKSATMPDVTGKSLRDALSAISYIVSNNNARIIIQGEGYVSDYFPKYGDTVSNNGTIRLILRPPLY